MNPFYKLLVVAASISLAACAFVPKVDHSQPYAEACEMYTKELTLDAYSLGGLDCGGNSSCAAVAGLIPVTTFLVSGSIVLVGNTVHWLEYQGSCDEGLIQSGIQKLTPDFLNEETDDDTVEDSTKAAEESIEATEDKADVTEIETENDEISQ